jgi:hypothetical protein
MKTIHQPPDSGTDPAAARYFRLLARAMEEVAAWYDGGLPPEPLAA